MFYHLQHRWRLEEKTLVYYGMRKMPYLFKNRIRLQNKQLRIVSSLPRDLSDQDMAMIKNMIDQGIVVTEDQLKRMPLSLDDAQFCQTCAANDYTIPGLEFNCEGLCPMCETKDDTDHLKSVLPVKNRFEHQKHRRFDVALFYTGGKDSTFLLNELANHQQLRVLAMTWEIPYMSESALESIRSAKKVFKNVEFVSRKLNQKDLEAIYQTLYDLEGNTCACPSVAYVLFYPDLVSEDVPYFVLGNEPVQMKNLYYNHVAPKMAFDPKVHRALLVGINLLRCLTLRRPLRQGQVHALFAMRELAGGRNLIKRLSGYENTLVEHVKTALRSAPNLLKPFKKAIRRSAFTGRVPAFVHVDFNDVSKTGRYVWSEIKEMIKEEAGWIEPKMSSKGLHTSCDIESCKEHTQYVNFLNMTSTMIPFSALEIALASSTMNLSREEAIQETKKHLGLTIDQRTGCLLMDELIKEIKRHDGQ